MEGDGGRLVELRKQIGEVNVGDEVTNKLSLAPQTDFILLSNRLTNRQALVEHVLSFLCWLAPSWGGSALGRGEGIGGGEGEILQLL